MTPHSPDPRSLTTAPARTPAPPLRAATWCLHVIVVALAVGSILTNRFDLWIDLRLLGRAGTPLKLLWALSTAALPFCAGPRLHALKPRWTHPGLSPIWACRLLWPTYLIMACLLANCVYYLNLYRQGLADLMLPMPLVMLLLLAAWTLLTRDWLRHLPRLPATSPTTRTTQILLTLIVLPPIAAIAGGFLLHEYHHSPTGNVDLAVVLGNSVRRNGRASVELTQRTQVAIDLYNQGRAKHILLSGAIYPPIHAGDPPQNEPAAMKQLCLEAGLPESAFSLDPVGVNTKATATNTRKFMQSRGYKTAVACTSEFHMYRTATSFENVGLEIFTLPGRKDYWLSPNPAAIVRELAGVVVYRLFPHYREPKALTMQLAAPRVIVRKTAGALELYDGPALVKTYACITGKKIGDKIAEGDHKTPIGSFHIVFKNPESKFHLSLGLDYPDKEDAQRGLASGLITQAQYDGILEALQSDLSRVENQNKLWYTPLGGEIFLHGQAEGRTGTAGCVALSNPDIDELYAILPLGTPVEIRP